MIKKYKMFVFNDNQIVLAYTITNTQKNMIKNNESFLLKNLKKNDGYMVFDFVLVNNNAFVVEDINIRQVSELETVFNSNHELFWQCQQGSDVKELLPEYFI